MQPKFCKTVHADVNYFLPFAEFIRSIWLALYQEDRNPARQRQLILTILALVRRWINITLKKDTIINDY